MELNRRSFVKTALAAGTLLTAGIAGTAVAQEAAPEPLPAPQSDPAGERVDDVNINMETIDQYLGRPDVAYRDVRHLYKTDESGAKVVDLSSTLKGFKVVPYIHIAPMGADTANGTELFTLEWDEDGAIVSATPNYQESLMIVEELFPRDRPIFIMCTSGGRANMTKKLLLFLGWDPALLYNVGGQKDYAGTQLTEIVVPAKMRGESDVYAVWRVDYATIDPELLHVAE